MFVASVHLEISPEVWGFFFAFCGIVNLIGHHLFTTFILNLADGSIIAGNEDRKRPFPYEDPEIVDNKRVHLSISLR